MKLLYQAFFIVSLFLCMASPPAAQGAELECKHIPRATIAGKLTSRGSIQLEPQASPQYWYDLELRSQWCGLSTLSFSSREPLFSCMDGDFATIEGELWPPSTTLNVADFEIGKVVSCSASSRMGQEEVAKLCQYGCADRCTSSDMNSACADCLTKCFEKWKPDQEAQKALAGPAVKVLPDSDKKLVVQESFEKKKIKIEDNDTACTADIDCTLIVLECETCCGSPMAAVNAASATKYQSIIEATCRDYQYSHEPCMCQPPEATCKKGRCVISQDWGGQKIQE